MAEGRGLDLLPWERYGSITPGMCSAQTYLSYVQATPDVFETDAPDALVSQIRCPLLLCYSTNEQQIAMTEDLERIRRNARAALRVDIRLIAGAEHGFGGHEPAAAAAIAQWIETLL